MVGGDAANQPASNTNGIDDLLGLGAVPA